MDAIFSAYVTNLGKYNEGQLVGEYLKFPTTTEEVQDLLKRIGVDGVRYEEIFITDYESSIDGLCRYMGEFESIDELNYLAALLDDLSPDELEKFEAAVDAGEYTGTAKNLINLAQNLDCYELYPDVHNEDDLGRMYILEFGAMTVPEHLIDYIDYEGYGRDVRINESGTFTDRGYFVDSGSGFMELYSGRDDIPEEHRVFALPKLSIREQMGAYKEVADRAAPDMEKHKPKPGREDR